MLFELPVVKYTLTLIRCFYLHSIFFDELFPIFSAASAQQKLGLGYSSNEIATSLCAAGPAILLALMAFPSLNQKLSYISIWRVSAIAVSVIYSMFPILPVFDDTSRTGNVFVCMSLIATRAFCLATGLTSINIMV